MNNKNFILPHSTFLDKKRLFLETFINTTDKVTKVSENSVLSGIASGVSRLSTLIEKDIAVYYSKLHPDYTYGEDLDTLSNLFGLPGRLGSSKSSTYLLVRAEPGTTYRFDEHYFLSNEGVKFNLSKDFTIGPLGYGYVSVSSDSSGSNTNVPPFSIVKLSNTLTGHISVFNEVGSIGGRDVEQDELFRRRIKEGINILSLNTLSSLEQRCINFNPDILKILHQGLTDNGKILIKVVTQNGIQLNQVELQQLTESISQYTSLTDHRSLGRKTNSIQFENIDFYPIDIELRCDFDGSIDYDSIRIDLQTSILKYLDWRYWDSSKQLVEWDNLLQISKSIKGIRYVQDQFFVPKKDIKIPENMLPRLRGFKLMNISGTLISNFYNVFPSSFYQNSVNNNYKQIL